MKNFRVRRILVLCAGLLGVVQVAPARAALTSFTGTFSVYMEGATASTPFSGTADVNLATGAFTFDGIPPIFGGVVWASAINQPITHPLFTHGTAQLGFQTSLASFYAGGGALGGFGGNGAVRGGFLGGGFTAGPFTAWTGYNTVGANYLGVAGANHTGISEHAYTVSGVPTVDSYVNLLQGRAWTANSLTFIVNGRTYFATGGDSRTTTNRGGNIVMITPIRLIAGMPNGGIGGYLKLAFNFTPVPEPGTAVLLGAGLVSLALAGRSRRARN